MKLSKILVIGLFVVATLSGCMSMSQTGTQPAETQGAPGMISQQEAVRIANEEAEAIGFDAASLKPEAKVVNGNWDVHLTQREIVPGGDVRVVIDGKTGAIIQSQASQ